MPPFVQKQKLPCRCELEIDAHASGNPTTCPPGGRRRFPHRQRRRRLHGPPGQTGGDEASRTRRGSFRCDRLPLSDRRPRVGSRTNQMTPVEITDSHHRAPIKIVKRRSRNTPATPRARLLCCCSSAPPWARHGRDLEPTAPEEKALYESKRQARTSCELRLVGYQVRTNLTEQGHALESRRGRTTGSQIPVSLSPDGAHGPRPFPPPLPRLEFRQVGGQRTPLPSKSAAHRWTQVVSAGGSVSAVVLVAVCDDLGAQLKLGRGVGASASDEDSFV